MPQNIGRVGPGFAQATQSPYAVGGGGTDMFNMGGLMSRQMAMREQLQQAELDRIYGQMDMARKAAAEENRRYQISRRDRQRKPKSKPFALGSAEGTPAQQRMLDMAKANAMAESLTQGRVGSAGANRGLAGMINAIGIPAAHQGLMQSGQLMGQGASNVAQLGTEMTLNNPQPQPQRRPNSMMPPTYEKGGRVPSTGTYELHQGEVVVPSDAADVMFPYARNGGPPKGRGKARKSYQEGTGAVKAGPLDAMANLLWNVMSAGGYSPVEGSEGITGGRIKEWDPEQLTETIQSMDPGQFGDAAPTGPMGPDIPEWLQAERAGAMTQDAPVPPGPSPMGIPGLTVEDTAPSAPSSTSFMGEDIQTGGLAAEAGQESVPLYTMTGAPESDKDRAQRYLDEADRFDRDADYHEARLNKVLGYVGGDPSRWSPEAQKMIRDRVSLAKSFRDREVASRKQAKAMKDRMAQTETAKEIAQVEATGRIGAAQVKTHADATRRAQGTYRTLLKDLAGYRGRANLSSGDQEDMIRTRLGELGPYLISMAEREGVEDPIGVAQMMLDRIATNYIDDPSSAGFLLDIIQDTLPEGP